MVQGNGTDLVPGEVQVSWESVAQRELGETAEAKRNCLAELRALISEDSLLRCPTDDAFLLKFLRGTKYQVKDAFNTIQAYFRSRKNHPEIFSKMRSDSFNYNLVVREHRLVAVLEEKDSLGRTVAFLKLGAWNTSICSVIDLIKATIIFAESSLHDLEMQIVGLAWVVDFKGLGLSQLRHYVPLIRTVTHLFQDCYPVRIKVIYVTNSPPLFETFLTFMKPFLKSKLLNRIIIVRDWKDLHDVISRELLPPELGGTRYVFDVDRIQAKLRTREDYFEMIERYGYLT